MTDQEEDETVWCDDKFHWMHLEPDNVADLLHDITEGMRTYGRTIAPKHFIVGIVSEDDGGIIAYAIGERHAEQIVAVLNAKTPQ